MKTLIHAFLLTGLAASAALAANPRLPFTRYEPILTRAPFGVIRAEPPDPDSFKPQPPPPAWDLRVVSLLQVNGDDLRAGLVDTKTQAPLMLKVGERDPMTGFALVEVDFSREAVWIERDGLTRELALFQGPAPGQNNRAQPAGVQRRTHRPPAGTYRKPLKTGRELMEHLQKYNDYVIRKNLPGLPIPLTPEQDAKLVRDGILPPQK